MHFVLIYLISITSLSMFSITFLGTYKTVVLKHLCHIFNDCVSFRIVSILLLLWMQHTSLWLCQSYLSFIEKLGIWLYNIIKWVIRFSTFHWVFYFFIIFIVEVYSSLLCYYIFAENAFLHTLWLKSVSLSLCVASILTVIYLSNNFKSKR